jgi:capsular polysaccharide biosynthesis protein
MPAAPHASRNCRNAVEVEALFAANGFKVICPELLDIGAQTGVFSNARIIAGFGGSAMFNVLFARQLETFIRLSHEAYTARNEHPSCR